MSDRLAVVTVAALLVGCSAQTEADAKPEAECNTDFDCPSIEKCVEGKCTVSGSFLFDGGPLDSGVAQDVGSSGPDSAESDAGTTDASSADANQSADTASVSDAILANDASMPADTKPSLDAAASIDVSAAGSGVEMDAATGADSGAKSDAGPADATVGPCKTGADCNDKLPCTADTCVGGKCVHTFEPTHCFIDGKCVPPKTKGPKNCQICAPLFNSKGWSIQDSLACDDGNACTSKDECDAKGVCKGKNTGCDDNNPCTTDSCVGTTCEHKKLPLCCASGPCCKLAEKSPKAVKTKCGTSVKVTELKCVGQAVQQRQAFEGCSGADGVCSTKAKNYHWTAWTTVKTCSGGTTCFTDGKTYTCKAGSGAKPDLKPSAFTTAVGSFAPGGKMATVAVVQNVGKGDAGAFKLAFRLSKDAKIDALDTLLDTVAVAGCKTGNSVVTTTSIHLPAGVATGNYYYGLVVDSGQAIPETDETNNTATIAITVSNKTIQGIDLVSASVTLKPGTVKAGDKIEANAVVKNIGAKAAGLFQVEFRLSSDATIGLGDKSLYTAYVPSLKPGQAEVIKRLLPIPATTKAGTWHIGAIVDSGGAIPEASESNNIAASVFKVTN